MLADGTDLEYQADEAATDFEIRGERRGFSRRLPSWFASRLSWFVIAGILAVAAFVRLWRFNDLGFNSDEAVYAGQGASIAHDPELSPFFPVFRAHPLLFQSIVSIGYQFGWTDWWGRFASVVFGVATVGLVYLTAKHLYGQRAGWIAAALIALMPYHIVVTRQVLLDGPQTFFTTLALYTLARFASSHRPFWLWASGAGIGLAVMAKEPTILFCGTVYAFFALAPEIKVRVRDVVIAGVILFLTIIPYPISIRYSGKPKTGGNFLAWQLFRRPNHSFTFYLEMVPIAIGVIVIAAAIVGIVIRRRRKMLTWRETLLLTWIAVPVVFFELWPVKGFQYLLPTAPAIAILAAGALVLPTRPFVRKRFARLDPAVVRTAGIVVVIASLAVPTFRNLLPSSRTTFLAGSGGLPGGREIGKFMQENIPEGATVLAIGPSMANIVQFYGHRRAYGLSVSSNPLHRNPAYEPIGNADGKIRNNEVQYLVWDSFTANRTPFFTKRLLTLAARYNGRAIFTHSVKGKTASGETIDIPVMRVYEVRP